MREKRGNPSLDQVWITIKKDGGEEKMDLSYKIYPYLKEKKR
jgi:hypothetical protein